MGGQFGTVSALQIEVCGRESFGNSRGLVSTRVFLPLCMNIIQKIYIGTSVSSSTMLPFCPIPLEFKVWLYLLCIWITATESFRFLASDFLNLESTHRDNSFHHPEMGWTINQLKPGKL